jgi:hypothetical protein
VPRNPKMAKHEDYILAQWPDDLSNQDKLSSPYHCCACKKPCYSIVTLRTHKCQGARKREKENV